MQVADPLRDEIVRRWGQKALVAVSLAIVTGRMYPTLKYALGHGKTCQRIDGGRPAGAVRAAAGARGVTTAGPRDEASPIRSRRSGRG